MESVAETGAAATAEVAESVVHAVEGQAAVGVEAAAGEVRPSSPSAAGVGGEAVEDGMDLFDAIDFDAIDVEALRVAEKRKAMNEAKCCDMPTPKRMCWTKVGEGVCTCHTRTTAIVE